MPRFRMLFPSDRIAVGDEVYVPSWKKRPGEPAGAWVEAISMIIGEQPGSRTIRRALTEAELKQFEEENKT